MLPLLLIACSTPPADTGEPAPWRALASDLPGALLSLQARSTDHLYTLGSDASGAPMAYHLDEAGWWSLELESPGDLWWSYEWGDQAWLVGDGGRVLTLTQRQLTGTTVLDPDTTLFGIWGTAPDNLYAVGSDGSPRMWHFDGAEWSAVTLPQTDATALFKVWGRSESEIWVIGDRGLSLHWAGRQWSLVETPTTESLYTLHGNSAQLYAVGGSSEGVILSWDGGWVDESPEGAAQLNGVHVRSQGCEPIAVGLYGAVWWRQDGVWTADPMPTNTTLGFHAAWIDPYCDPWVVGGALSSWPMASGVLLYRGDHAPPQLNAAPLPDGEDVEEVSIITVLEASCEETGWQVEVEIAGSTDGAQLTLSTADAEELHPLSLSRMHPQGYWSRWAIALPVVETSEQVDGESTRFACDAPLTFTAERLNAGGEVTDCLSWGEQPGEC